MSQKLIDGLASLGLSETEALMYLALVRHSPCFVAPLVQETQKHRQIVYNALEALQKRNLVTRSLRNGKYLYELNDPSRLMTIVEEQEEAAKTVIAAVKDQIRSSGEQVETLRGIEGYKLAISGLLRSAEENGDYLILNSIAGEFLKITSSFRRNFIERLGRVKESGGQIKVLTYTEHAKAHREKELGKLFFGEPFEVRVLTDMPTPPQTTWISGESVYTRNRLADPLIVHTKSPDLAGRYREYFHALWGRAEEL
jgi:sugar-specific transcriptional regulator TrmB